MQTAVDGDNALIVDFEVVNTNDRGNMHKLAAKGKKVLETDELISIADKGYISTTDIANCIADGITADISSEILVTSIFAIIKILLIAANTCNDILQLFYDNKKSSFIFQFQYLLPFSDSSL